MDFLLRKSVFTKICLVFFLTVMQKVIIFKVYHKHAAEENFRQKRITKTHPHFTEKLLTLLTYFPY